MSCILKEGLARSGLPMPGFEVIEVRLPAEPQCPPPTSSHNDEARNYTLIDSLIKSYILDIPKKLHKRQRPSQKNQLSDFLNLV